ncbi:hypothetical protein ACI3EY_11765 [Ornithinimicrobium sp. LYQ92]|uniref:hypothetical protein n=1 Tax=Serinicoccus sp. LYQ92 TaxID=3378798 RepID=UPI003852D216
MSTGTGPGATGPRPERPVEQDWLALRVPADTAARDSGSAVLLDTLRQRWTDRAVRSVQVVDLGAGTGANRAYLEPRLGLPQRWTVLDHDPEHLDHPGHGDAERVCAGVAELPGLLAQLRPGPGEALLVTCAALLDVLGRDDLEVLAEAVVGSGADLLLAMSVTGEVGWEPAEADDALLAEAFDAHQQRQDRPGPLAVPVLVRMLEERGRAVRTADTPWLLPDAGAGSGEQLLRRFLDERVRDALEVRPGRRAALTRWQGHRHGQLGAGALTVRVGHTDLLSCPEVSGEAPAR